MEDFMNRKSLFIALFSALMLAVGWPVSAATAPQTAVLEEGSAVQVRLAEFLSSEQNRTGDRFETILDEDLKVQGWVVAPAGSIVVGEVVEAIQEDKDVLTLTLRDLEVDGRRYSLSTNNIRVEAKGGKKKDATIIGGGAGLGALLGAIIGGKTGAVLGAVIGAGAGTTAVLVTDGEKVEFEPEQRFRFFLQNEVRMDVLGRPGEFDRSDRARTTRDDRRDFDRRTQEEIERTARDLWTASRDLEKEVAREIQNRNRSAGNRDQENQQLHLYFELSSFATAAKMFADWSRQMEEESLLSVFQSLQQRHSSVQDLSRSQTLSRSLENHWREVTQEMDHLDGLFDQADWRASGDASSDDRDRGTLRWQGTVDGQDYVMLQGNQVDIRHLKGQTIRDSNARLTAPLPRTEVELSVRSMDGRGSVSIVQTPSRWNDYTAIVLVDDDRFSGQDRYEFELTWQRK